MSEKEKPSTSVNTENVLERRVRYALDNCIPEFLAKVEAISIDVWSQTTENQERINTGSILKDGNSQEAMEIRHTVRNMVELMSAVFKLSKYEKTEEKAHTLIAHEGSKMMTDKISFLRGYFEDEKYIAIHDEGMAFLEQLEDVKALLNNEPFSEKTTIVDGTTKQQR